MLGRGSRTLSKLFEELVSSLDEYDRILFTAKEFLTNPQGKFIKGIKY